MPVARQLSRRAVIDALLAHGRVSRAAIARMTGLSKQTISEVMRELEDGGWVREEGEVQGAVGRSAITYEIVPRAACVLGIDLGGTKLHVALADLKGEIIAEAIAPTEPQGARHVVEQIGLMTERLVAEAGLGPGTVRLATMASPGVFDPRSGSVGIAPNIPGLADMDVRGALQRRLGCPVAIENDVNLAAAGEQWQGRGRDSADFAFIAIGTGIGMGIVANGSLLRGWRGAAGEVAYLPVGGDPYDARNLTYGTLETAVSSAAIGERYRGLGGPAGATVRDIFAALPDDEAARVTIAETARIVAAAIIAVSALLDPEFVAMGGSIGTRPELLAEIRLCLRRGMTEPVRVEISALGSRATLIGALGQGLRALHGKLFGIETGAPVQIRVPPRNADAA